jgi:hypothetical protein
MVKRITRSPRFPVNTNGKFGAASPVAKIWVNPGETLNRLKFKARIQSSPIAKPLAGAYVDTWFFYVPHSVSWDGWHDFALSGTGTVTHTSGATAVSRPFFKNYSQTREKLYESAYAEIINIYFRGKGDVAHSVGGGLAQLPACDMTGERMALEDEDAIDQTINVSSGTLSLKEVSEKFAELRRLRKIEEWSTSYVDYLKRFGVNSKQLSTIEPEMLGHVRKWVYPSKTISQSNGTTVQSYFCDIDMRLDKRRFFPEHGYIIGISSIRPKIVYEALDTFDEFFVASHGSVPMLDMAPEDRRVSQSTTAYLASYNEVQTYNMANFLKYGQSLTGKFTDSDAMHYGKVGSGSRTMEDLRVPPVGDYTALLAGSTTLSDSMHYAIDGVSSVSIHSPLTWISKAQKPFD